MASVGPAATRPRGRRLANLARLQALRCEVFFRRTRLDEQLASGLDPDSNPALALRAAQLLRIRYRRRLAGTVKALVDDLDEGERRQASPAVPVRRDQVAEARDSLLSLSHALSSAEGVRPRGVAMVVLLIEDPASALYSGVARGTLQLQVGTVLDCLVGQRQPDQEAWRVASPTEGSSRGIR